MAAFQSSATLTTGTSRRAARLVRLLRAIGAPTLAALVLFIALFAGTTGAGVTPRVTGDAGGGTQ